MCSISGFYNPSAQFTGQRDYFLHILEDMKNCMNHRGPDDNDRILTEHCGVHSSKGKSIGIYIPKMNSIAFFIPILSKTFFS